MCTWNSQARHDIAFKEEVNSSSRHENRLYHHAWQAYLNAVPVHVWQMASERGYADNSGCQVCNKQSLSVSLVMSHRAHFRICHIQAQVCFCTCTSSQAKESTVRLKIHRLFIRPPSFKHSCFE